MRAGSCCPGTCGPAGHLCKSSMGLDRIGSIGVCWFHQCLGHRNSGSLNLAEDAFHNTDMHFSEVIGWRVV